MGEARAAGIQAAVIEAGLAGVTEPDLLRGFCIRLNEHGVPATRSNVVIDTLHPVHEGRVFRWRRHESEPEPIIEYGRSDVPGDAADSWRSSPFYHLIETGGTMLRRRLAKDPTTDFPILEELRAKGQTDLVVLVHRFAADSVIGQMDGVYSSWATDAPDGFSDEEVAILCEVVPSLVLALKSASLARIAETLVETYLGRDAGRRVLSGRIERGTADRIEAVLWFSDLRGYTAITDQAAPEQVIPFLNDYAEAIISSIHEAGGDVLKLIGDGTLAIFTAADPATACRCALAAEELMRSRIGALNQKRASRHLPVTKTSLGLHIGEVFYGNIGSRDRLDFTVVGPAVNEVSRIVALCRSVEQEVLVSSGFGAAASEADRARLVSVGRYALKGVERPQELFTLEPPAERL